MPITTHLDDTLNAFVVTFPDNVRLAELHAWREAFLILIREQPRHPRPALLLDTAGHEFESIACLKLLRALFSEEKQAKNAFSRVAFIQPRHYREPEILSPVEAYFTDAPAARAWLARQRQNEQPD